MINFYIFEIKYWLRQPMVYVFFFINALMIFGATSSDNITVGGSFGNIMKNSPFVIQMYYSVMSFITLLMTTSFILASTTRDFTYNTYQIIFTTPVKRSQYLLGRFLGATTISVIPLLGVSVGILAGCMMPWVDPAKIGEFYPEAHLAGILQLAIPNTLFGASVVFMIAALTRNTIAAFVGSLILLVATAVAGAFADDLETEWLAILVDPFGSQTFSVLTKYWTVNQKNTEVLPLVSLYLYNRVLWLVVSLLLVFITIRMFSFTEKASSRKRKISDENETPQFIKHAPLPTATQTFNKRAFWTMFRKQAIFEIKTILKSPAFIVILLAGLLNFLPNIIINSDSYGLTTHPVTYMMINMIEGSFYMFLIAIIIIYSGLLVWKERENKIDEIYDATPHPTWTTYLSKFSAIAIVIFIIQLLCIIACIITQLAKGFYDIRPWVYVKSLLIIDYSGLLFLVAMSMLMHSLINNKYIAFFAFVIFLVMNNLLWVILEVESNMVKYGGRPSYIYSDMNGFGPFVEGILWFRGYWMLFVLMLGIVTVFAWTRGKETAFRKRLTNVWNGIQGRTKPALVTLFALWLLCGSFVYYNTKSLNQIVTSDELELLQVGYEKKYKQYQGINQPRITDVKYTIDIYPEQRKLEIDGMWWIKNKSDEPIDSVHINLVRDFKTIIKIPGSMLVHDDHKHLYRIYKLHNTLNPGDSLKVMFTSVYDVNGFENEVSFTSVVDNGSFFNNFDFSPQIGYQPNREISDRDDRKKKELGEKERMPSLERNCTDRCMNHYLSNHSDWVNVETVISTSADQTGIAPGSLLKQWSVDGRNFFHYRLDHYSLNFYSFISARYEVLREKHRDIDVEVYYDRRHEYNIENMQRSMQRSLDYFITNFGPYYHKQVRIIEFPRYGSFAQAFPGTMPYSEGIGFIAKIDDEDDIDMVFYVVAHEMAHQYWAHQVVGAEMQGATMLSETFSQYAALMVMEKEYGRNAMKKFLKYEMDSYLRSRGTERIKEVPLMEVENQGYIHYRKGSLVMYYLKEMIGEERVNVALRKLIDRFAYAEPPYPTAHHAVDAFRAQTPDSLKYIIADLFETITLYNNRATNATVKEIEGNKFELTLEFNCQKYRADSLGKETEIPLNDWMEIGVFAKPSGKKKLGEVIYRKKHFINTKENTLKLIVDQKPYEAGVDPMNLLVDLIGDDNLRRVE